MVTDDDLGGTIAITQVLRFAADDDARMEHVVLAKRDMSGERDVIQEPRTATDGHVWAHDAEGTDLDIVIDVGSRIDDRMLGNDGSHGPNSRQGQSVLDRSRVETSYSGDAASLPHELVLHQ